MEGWTGVGRCSRDEGADVGCGALHTYVRARMNGKPNTLRDFVTGRRT